MVVVSVLPHAGFEPNDVSRRGILFNLLSSNLSIFFSEFLEVFDVFIMKMFFGSFLIRSKKKNYESKKLYCHWTVYLLKFHKNLIFNHLKLRLVRNPVL